MRAVIYTRTAAGTGRDLQQQLEQCRAYAARQGWGIAGEYSDTGSGYRSRPGFDAVMALIRSRGCDRLVAPEMSRLTRSLTDAGTILAEAETAGVAVVTADSMLDTSTAPGRLTARIASAARHASAD